MEAIQAQSNISLIKGKELLTLKRARNKRSCAERRNFPKDKHLVS
jgi:hypothetical protein